MINSFFHSIYSTKSTVTCCAGCIFCKFNHNRQSNDVIAIDTSKLLIDFVQVPGSDSNYIRSLQYQNQIKFIKIVSQQLQNMFWEYPELVFIFQCPLLRAFCFTLYVQPAFEGISAAERGENQNRRDSCYRILIQF